MPITLHELATDVGDEGAATVTLFAPELHYTSTNQSEYPACMDWRADLWLSQLEFDDSATVVGGSVDFLTVRLGEEHVANLLDALSGQAEYFAGLFDGRWLDDDMQEQFHAMPIDTALIVVDVFVAEPLRGNHLGPWMVADVVYRMLPSTSGIVVLSPDPATDDDDVTVTNLFALEKLTNHWARAGLDPIATMPEFLGQSTAYTALTPARATLAGVAEKTITVTVGALATCTDLPPLQ